MKKHSYLIFGLLWTTNILLGQCYPNRHSTNFFDGWISCETAINPNPARPVSHFIMYDYGDVFRLGQMQIWNANDPSHLDWGMRDVVIDYSIDGAHWSEAGNYTFGQASGLSTYEGEPGPHLNDIEARYLLITGVNNYGGECYGLSEVRVNAEEVIISGVDDIEALACVDVVLYPNPFADKMTVSLTPGCTGEFRYMVYDALGHELMSDKISLLGNQKQNIELGAVLPAGAFVLFMEFDGKSIQKRIIKMSKT